jgi:prepilin-type N-terminal cleavage/methylation domain-containing protein
VRDQRGFTLIELMVALAIILIFVSIAFSLTLTNYGGNAQNTADAITGQLNLARMRAVSTKNVHAVEIKQQSVTIWQCNSKGMVAPSPSVGAAGCPSQVVEYDLPNNVWVWNAQLAANSMPGANPSQNAAIDFWMPFYGDGSSPGGATIFVTDRQQKAEYRVIVYPITGEAYDRVSW